MQWLWLKFGLVGLRVHKLKSCWLSFPQNLFTQKFHCLEASTPLLFFNYWSQLNKLLSGNSQFYWRSKRSMIRVMKNESEHFFVKKRTFVSSNDRQLFTPPKERNAWNQFRNSLSKLLMDPLTCSTFVSLSFTQFGKAKFLPLKQTTYVRLLSLILDNFFPSTSLAVHLFPYSRHRRSN